MSERDMQDLIARVERALGVKWNEVVEWMRTQHSLPELEDAIAEGDTTGIIDTVEEAAKRFADGISAGYAQAGEETASWLGKLAKKSIRFDGENERAAAWAEDNAATLVKGLTYEAKQTVRQVIADGVRNGQNPRQTARDLRDSLGLTPDQADAVASYRDALESSDYSDALGRALSDGRDDRVVRAAQRNGKAIDPDRIDAMVERYRKNYVAHRATVVARTESLRAVHAGNEELFQQAIDNEDVEADALERSWSTAGDPRVRASHRSMNNQKRAVGEMFVTGDGIELAYPGDPEADPSETVNCRCCIATRYVG